MVSIPDSGSFHFMFGVVFMVFVQMEYFASLAFVILVNIIKCIISLDVVMPISSYK